MFEYAVKKAREMADDYHLYVLGGGNGVSRKCEKQFLWRCQDSGYPIKVLYLPNNMPPAAMPGTYVRTADGFDIVLLPNLPPEFERFVLVKEIFHAILDAEAFHNMDVLDHLDKTLFGEGSSPIPLNVLSEYATHAAAAEFLFPHKMRHDIVTNNRKDYRNIASDFDIPISVVEHYLTASAMKFYEIP
jgi:Zn-dependent peptidase ImmA (M78 family)